MDERALADLVRPVVDDLGHVAAFAWERGWAEGGAGNASVDVTGLVDHPAPDVAHWRRVPAEVLSPELVGRWLLVTATGARFRDLARDPARGLLLLRVDESLQGLLCAPAFGHPDQLPTSELATHLWIHATLGEAGGPLGAARRSGKQAVLHAHPTHVIALSHAPDLADGEALNRALWDIHPEVKTFLPEGVGLVRYHLPGSDDLARVTADAVARHRVVIWARHGCVAVSGDLQSAFDLMDTVDKAARMVLLCRAAGYEPRGLSHAHLGDLTRLAGGGEGDEGGDGGQTPS